MTNPRIVDLKSIKMLGMKRITSLAGNKTRELWGEFMPRVKEIKQRPDKDLYSIQQYSKDLKMEMFTPHTQFIKWAAVQVLDFEHIPKGMDHLIIPCGLYAVFIHKGPVRSFHKTSQYIYGQWIPGSDYILGHRPHFEIMTEEYLGPDHPDSEEEVWIPIKSRL